MALALLAPLLAVLIQLLSVQSETIHLTCDELKGVVLVSQTNTLLQQVQRQRTQPTLNLNLNPSLDEGHGACQFTGGSDRSVNPRFLGPGARACGTGIAFGGEVCRRAAGPCRSARNGKPPIWRK